MPVDTGKRVPPSQAAWPAWGSPPFRPAAARGPARPAATPPGPPHSAPGAGAARRGPPHVGLTTWKPKGNLPRDLPLEAPLLDYPRVDLNPGLGVVKKWNCAQRPLNQNGIQRKLPRRSGTSVAAREVGNGVGSQLSVGQKIRCRTYQIFQVISALLISCSIHPFRRTMLKHADASDRPNASLHLSCLSSAKIACSSPKNVSKLACPKHHTA